MNLRQNFELYKKLKRENGTIQVNSKKHYNLAVVPESASGLVENLARSFADDIMHLKKRSLLELRDQLDKQAMQRQERSKLYSALDKMDHLAMHAIPGNQRWRFEKILFYSLNVDDYDSVILVDDSSFSGWTMKAMKYAVSRYDGEFVAFSY